MQKQTKKSTPPLIKHEKHQVEIRLSKDAKKHSAFYHCVECNKWVAWVSKRDFETAKKLGLISE